MTDRAYLPDKAGIGGRTDALLSPHSYPSASQPSYTIISSTGSLESAAATMLDHLAPTELPQGPRSVLVDGRAHIVPDLTHHLSEVSKKRLPSPLKQLAKYMAKPGIDLLENACNAVCSGNEQ